MLQGKGPRFTFDSEVQSRLQIIGLVRVAESGHLVPRNRIFERVFDEGWVHRRSRKAQTDIQRLESNLRYGSDPQIAFRAAADLRAVDPERLREVLRSLEGVSIEDLFLKGAEHADDGDVLGLAKLLAESATRSELVAVLQRVDKVAAAQARRDETRAALANRVQRRSRVAVHVIYDRRRRRRGTEPGRSTSVWCTT